MLKIKSVGGIYSKGMSNPKRSAIGRSRRKQYVQGCEMTTWIFCLGNLLFYQVISL